MIRTLIVENEKNIAVQFTGLITRMFKDIELLPVCDNVDDALVSIHEHNPDLVFLDVELNNGETGFDILRQLSSINFEIVFATAFNKYAVQAIKFSALDYILKPVTEDDLAETINRFNKKRNSFNPKQLETLFSNLQKGVQMNQVALPTMQGLDFVITDSIIYCEGESNLSISHPTDHPVSVATDQGVSLPTDQGISLSTDQVYLKQSESCFTAN